MLNFLPKSIRAVIDELSKLPGIGPKSAQRLAIYLLHSPDARVESFGEALLKLKKNVTFCSNCWNIAEVNPCTVCSNPERDESTICVVENILDVLAIEKTSEFNGHYHVLHGALSPINRIGPDQLKLSELFSRIENNPEIKEIILATNPSLEGEATALYVQKHLREHELSVTRIARGLPVGGDLEYADEITVSRAIKGRSDF